MNTAMEYAIAANGPPTRNRVGRTVLSGSADKSSPKRNRWFADSPLEESGFELVVSVRGGYSTASASIWAFSCSSRPLSIAREVLNADGGRGGKWSVPTDGTVCNRKSRRRAQGLIDNAVPLTHLDETLHRLGVGVGVQFED
jgi:hypothetical protein